MTIVTARRGLLRLLRKLPRFDRNVLLYFAIVLLSGIGQGIFTVVFNLYVLAVGIDAAVLGRLLSAGPFAQALGSIPVGFMTEVIGYRGAIVAIYGSTGLSQIAQAATPSALLIFAAAFVGGLGFAGDFVVRLPFLAAYTPASVRTQAFSIASILSTVSRSLGALIAGYAPQLMRPFAPDLATGYRYTLYIAGVLTLLSVVPGLLIARPVREVERAPLSLRPYLWGMDRFTLQQAIVSLFVGASVGVVVPFFNLYFIYHLGTSLELYSIITALSVVPNFIATAFGPALAARVGSVQAVTLLRVLIFVTFLVMAVTMNPIVGTIGYWAQYALFMMAQPLSFAFAMEAATPRAKGPASAWLNVTYWLGLALTTPVGGAFIARSNYTMPLCLSGLAMGMGALCNHFFFQPIERAQLRQERLLTHPVQTEHRGSRRRGRRR